MSNVLNVQRVAVEPGDLVIVKVAGAGTAERAQIAADIMKSLPKGARVWVTGAEVREVVAIGGKGCGGPEAVLPLTPRGPRRYPGTGDAGYVHLNPYAVSAASVSGSPSIATVGDAGTSAVRIEAISALGPDLFFTEESIRNGGGGGSCDSGEIDAQTGKRVA